MSKEKSKKIYLIIGIMVAILIAITIIVILIHKDKDVYRFITVDSMDGTVDLSREGETIEIFKGIHLKSGDAVSTGEESYALLLVDEDKHILAEENTGFSINATGNEDKGGVTIHLEYGSTLITIDNKLEEDSSFKVKTPNATLSVRGTVFRATYDRDLMYTTVEVLEGTVEISSETNSILGNVGEFYYVDMQGAIQSGIPNQDTEGSSEENSEENSVEVGTDIEPLPDNANYDLATITQADFEANYIEERIELTADNSHEYFEIIEKDGTYYFVLKPGYTAYDGGYSLETSNGDMCSVSTGASRYLFYMEGSGNADNWIESWVASGTIVKYSIPDNMWCKAGDKYIVMLKMNNGEIYTIER